MFLFIEFSNSSFSFLNLYNFLIEIVFVFRFLLCPITTEAMGIWRFAGAFAVVKRQGECGSKTAGMHFSQPMNIGVCYAFGV